MSILNEAAHRLGVALAIAVACFIAVIVYAVTIEIYYALRGAYIKRKIAKINKDKNHG